MNINVLYAQQVEIHILRREGAIVDVYTDPEQCKRDMKTLRKNSEYWRIETRQTAPHGLTSLPAPELHTKKVRRVPAGTISGAF
jgi:hypothetical protein